MRIKQAIMILTLIILIFLWGCKVTQDDTSNTQQTLKYFEKKYFNCGEEYLFFDKPEIDLPINFTIVENINFSEEDIEYISFGSLVSLHKNLNKEVLCGISGKTTAYTEEEYELKHTKIESYNYMFDDTICYKGLVQTGVDVWEDYPCNKGDTKLVRGCMVEKYYYIYSCCVYNFCYKILDKSMPEGSDNDDWVGYKSRDCYKNITRCYEK